MNIAIVTDGNNALGMGHVYQALTLAERLKEKLADHLTIRFLTKSDDFVVSLLEKSGRTVLRYENDEVMFEALRKQCVDHVIIDKLDVNPEFAKCISEQLKVKLTILTNLTDANRFANLTVMAGMGSAFKNIRRQNENGQVQLWGPRYWLIRPEFFSQCPKQTDAVQRVMLMFGGADPANLSSLVTDELLKMNKGFDITVVLGAAFTHRSELNAVIAKHGASSSTVHIVSNLEAVAQVMHRNDLVLVSPGLSFFEALLVGTPVLCFHQNDFQKNAWNGFIKTYSKEDVPSLGELIEAKSFIRPDDPSILSMDVGGGIDEIIREILA